MAEVNGLNPSTARWDTNGLLYANSIYDPLMWVGRDGSAHPYLAESMTPDQTFTTWTMTLRPGIQFHDGSTLDATVVKNNWDALASSLLTGEAAKGVEAQVTGPLTLTYTLDQPRPHFPFTFTTQGGYVVGQATLDQGSSGGPSQAVGTGPFVLTSWEPNQHFETTRNPDYWRTGYPHVDRVTFVPILDSGQRTAALQSGSVDLMVTTDPNAIRTFRGHTGFQLVDSLTGVVGEPTVASIVLNTSVAPTDDRDVREALARATDVGAVVRVFGGGLTRPIDGLFLPGSPYDANTGYPTYDPGAARQLVARYRSRRGTVPSLTLSSVTDSHFETLVQMLKQMWNEVGIDVTLSVMEPATLIADLVAGKFQAAVDYQYGAVDPDLNYQWFSTTTTGQEGVALNFSRNTDPRIETALQQGRTTTDPTTRIAAYRQLNRRLAADLPNLWLEQVPFAVVAQQRVRNFAGLTLPDGSPGYGFDEGVFFPSQLWLDR